MCAHFLLIMAGGSLLTKTFFLHFHSMYLFANVPATVTKPALIWLFIRAAFRNLHLKQGVEQAEATCSR